MKGWAHVHAGWWGGMIGIISRSGNTEWLNDGAKSGRGARLNKKCVVKGWACVRAGWWGGIGMVHKSLWPLIPKDRYPIILGVGGGLALLGV